MCVIISDWVQSQQRYRSALPLGSAKNPNTTVTTCISTNAYFSMASAREGGCHFSMSVQETKNPHAVPFNRIDVGISHLTTYILHLIIHLIHSNRRINSRKERYSFLHFLNILRWLSSHPIARMITYANEVSVMFDGTAISRHTLGDEPTSVIRSTYL